MREGMGSVFLYNIIILFIVIVFAFLAGTVSYSKAFRVNSKIINSIEKFEGYNALAQSEAERTLNNLGYKIGSSKCGKRSNADPIENEKYDFCVYYLPEKNNKYYRYGVLTYLYLDIPVVGNSIKIPVYSKTEKIYKFNK